MGGAKFTKLSNLWKHMFPGSYGASSLQTELTERARAVQSNASDVVVVIVVRSPSGFVRGVMKEPYDLQECFREVHNPARPSRPRGPNKPQVQPMPLEELRKNTAWLSRRQCACVEGAGARTGQLGKSRCAKHGGEYNGVIDVWNSY